MKRLIDEYFLHYNLYLPLLHRPTFESDIQKGLHLADEGFGAVVLLVCAIGSRFVDDPAVLPPGVSHWHWAGWPWFDRVNSNRKLVHFSASRIYDLQIDTVRRSHRILLINIVSDSLDSFWPRIPLLHLPHRLRMQSSAMACDWRKIWEHTDGLLTGLPPMQMTN